MHYNNQHFKFIAICVIAFAVNSCNAQSSDIVFREPTLMNKPCTTSNRKAGTCQVLSKCPKNRVVGTPQRCGFENGVLVVCCELPPTVTTTAKPTINYPKSEQKCREYQQYIYSKQIEYGIDGPTEYKKDECGHKVVTLIVGGTVAEPKEFPHMALLGYALQNTNGISYECGGSLVSERFVVTAGHCLSSRDNGPVTVVKVGDLILDSDVDDARPEVIRIAEIIQYPEYTRSTQYNDIALLRLEGAATLNKYVIPICLPQSDKIPEQKAIASGWGNVGWMEGSSSTLLKVTLDFFTHQECIEDYQATRKLPNGIVESQQICAGSKSKRKDTCQGDSGGPLQIYNQDIYCMYTIVGVTSFGKSCGTVGLPGVYTRVVNYVPWIESVIWA